MRRATIFSSDMPMISNFNVIISIIIVTDLTFSRVLKICIVFFSHQKLFVKMFLHHVTAIFTLLDQIINETVNCISADVCLNRLTKLVINTYANL